MPTTSTLLLPYPAPSAVPDVPLDMQALADRLETLLAGAWSTYTPTTTNTTIGNGTLRAAYKQLGKTVWGQIDLTWGSTTSALSTITFSPPVTPLTTSLAAGGRAIGSALMYDSSAGTAAKKAGTAFLLNSTSILVMSANDTTPLVTNAAPWTWATGDSLSLAFQYEAA
jgi:hypothetical protein